ncbi:MAG: class I tRNA ligase family protein, partial [Candidatus Omnitrophota bacterium]
YKFLGRVWRLVEKVTGSKPQTVIKDKLSKEEEVLRRKTHQTIKKVTEDLEGGFHFNTAISAIMELVNSAYDLAGSLENVTDVSPVLRDAAENIVLLLSPFVPHVAEEMWSMLGHKESILKASWPSYDNTAISEPIVTIPIQVNGKLRSRIDVPAEIKEDALKKLVLLDEKVKPHIAGKTVRDVIIVPKRLANIVLG